MPTQVLEVAIGLVLSFLIVSTISSAIIEGVAIVLQKRSKDLEKVIKGMMNDPGAAVDAMDLYATSVFRTFEMAAGRKNSSTATSGKRKPSYVSARSFADAVVEKLSELKTELKSGVATGQDLLNKLPANSPIKKRVEALVGEAGGDLQTVKAGLESWFDDTMDRLSGAFKRWSQYCLLFVGIAVALCLNVSAVRIVNSLWTDAPVRSAVADSASQYLQQNPPTAETPGLEGVQKAIKDLDALKLPVGWGSGWEKSAGAGWTLLGTIITGLAVLMGAPFWFDLLTKLIAARKATSVPPKASEDPASASSAIVAAARTGPLPAVAPPPPAGPTAGAPAGVAGAAAPAAAAAPAVQPIDVFFALVP